MDSSQEEKNESLPIENEEKTDLNVNKDEDTVNSGTFTRVYFRVKAECRLGEEVHCSGSSFSMGQYNPNESVKLVTTPSEYPIWRTDRPMILPRGVPHRYMYALFSGGEFASWESIDPDRSIIPEGREMIINEEFGIYDESMILKKTEEIDSTPNQYHRVQAPSAEETVDSRIHRSSSQNFPLSKLQSGYKRYLASSFKPDSNSTLFLVCYHLPVFISKDENGTWIAEWNHDSLISRTEGSIAESMNVMWVGSITHETMADPDKLSAEDKEQIRVILQSMQCIPVFIPTEVATNHYLGYCKSKLWPMFHNVDVLDLYSSVWNVDQIQSWHEQDTGKWWDAYQETNRSLAETVLNLSKPGDTAWVHDYHLLLFPSYIVELAEKRRRSSPSMVFFLHVPFPTSEIFRELSNGPRLLEGMLSADVVGFHSFDHARHFLNACKRFLGLSYQSRRGGNLGVNYHGRNVIVTISHVGLEKNYTENGLSDAAVTRASEDLRSKYPGKIIICGVDTCQRLSGVALKLLAIEQLIKMYPVWQDKVVLVQRCLRSSTRKGDENHSSSEIMQLVDRITSKYGPVIDYEECVKPTLKERLALWLASDILLTTSIREGLNLKPLEYVFAKKDAGVVILSEFSACCCVLNGAIRINPWNLLEVTQSLDQALVMNKQERLGRRARDLPYITNQPASGWTRQILSVLQEATETMASDEEYTDMEHTDTETGRSHVLRIGESTDFMQLDVTKVEKAYKSSKRRVFLLDYGGTIIARENMSMYVKKDFTAVTGRVPSPRMMEALSLLSSDPRNTVFVVSGVSQLNLTTVLGHIKGLGLAAENGALYSWAEGNTDGTNTELTTFSSSNSPVEKEKGTRHWHQHNFSYDWNEVRAIADPILMAYTTRTNGSILKYMDQGIAWNYRSTDPEWGLMQANQLQAQLEEVLKDYTVTVIRKKGLLEIVPEGLHKGVVAREILHTDAIRHKGHPDFLFCIGDDTTDESMFKSIYEYIAERSEESVHGNMHLRDEEGPIIEGHLQHVFTCTVGKKPSNAHLYVNEVQDVEDLLHHLCEPDQNG